MYLQKQQKIERQLVTVNGLHPSQSSCYINLEGHGHMTISGGPLEEQLFSPAPKLTHKQLNQPMLQCQKMIKQTVQDSISAYTSNSGLTFGYVCTQIPKCMLSNP